MTRRDGYVHLRTPVYVLWLFVQPFVEPLILKWAAEIDGVARSQAAARRW